MKEKEKKKPDFFVMRSTLEFEENFEKVWEQQRDDSLTGTELVRRLFRHAAKTGLRLHEFVIKK